jgi:hypothetical protein
LKAFIVVTVKLSQEKRMSVLASEALPSQPDNRPAQRFAKKVTEMAKDCLVIRPALRKRTYERRAIRSSAGTSTPLLVVGARWRDIAQQDSGEPADIDADLKRCRRGKNVARSLGKQVLQAAILLRIQLCRMFVCPNTHSKDR